jgi:phage gpG-like protein
VRLTLTVAGVDEAREVLAAAAARLEQPARPLLEVLAAELQTYFQVHINEERGPGGPWPPLSRVTQKIREYYGHPGDHPQLVRAGDLLHSISTLALEESAVEVGTRMHYARVLQDGGTVADAKTGRPREVQAFPFAYVAEQELADLVTLITEYYFGAAA